MKWNKDKDVLALMVGHGTQTNGVWDPGATYGVNTEAGLMLDIVKYAVWWLRKSGVKVLTDADKGNNINMVKSVAAANQKGCRLYLVCHCDYKDAASGVMFYYASSAGKKFGDKVGKYCAKYMGLKFKGGKKDPAKYEVGQTIMPSVLLETGAIKADLKTLRNCKRYGKVLAKAICKYIGVKFYVTRRARFLKKLNSIVTYANKHHFKYTKSWKDCGKNWKEAKKLKRMNCSMFVCYALQLIGVLKDGQFFWLNGDKIVCKGAGTKARVQKYFTVLHPHKKPNSAGLKKADICGYKNNAHTQVYVEKKSTYPVWFSWGPSDVGKKQPRRKKSYDTKVIYTVMRLKA